MKFSSPLPHHRSTWSLDGLSASELLALLQTARRLKLAARAGRSAAPLRGKQLALVGDRDGSGAALLRDAAAELGARVTSLHADGIEDLTGSSRLLGRLYDAVDCSAPLSAEEVERAAGIPVFNGLGGEAHPARALAALLSIQEAAGQPLQDVTVGLLGDAGSPCGRALVKAAARGGFALQMLPRADGAADADFVLDIRDPARWLLTDRAGHVLGDEPDDRRFMLQALLVSTLN